MLYEYKGNRYVQIDVCRIKTLDRGWVDGIMYINAKDSISNPTCQYVRELEDFNSKFKRV